MPRSHVIWGQINLKSKFKTSLRLIRSMCQIKFDPIRYQRKLSLLRPTVISNSSWTWRLTSWAKLKYCLSTIHNTFRHWIGMHRKLYWHSSVILIFLFPTPAERQLCLFTATPWFHSSIEIRRGQRRRGGYCQTRSPLFNRLILWKDYWRWWNHSKSWQQE